MKNSGDFINKMRNLQNIPDGKIFITADLVDLYPSIIQEAALNVLRKALGNTENKHIATDNLIIIAEFVLKYNCSDLMIKLKNYS